MSVTLRPVLITVILLLLLLSLCGLTDAQDSVLIGKAAPALKSQQKGQKDFDISSLGGKVVLIVFWVPSPPGNLDILNQLEEIRSRFSPNDFEIITVNMRSQGKQSKRGQPDTMPGIQQIQGSGQNAFVDWRVSFSPAAYLINRSGIIIDVFGNKGDFDYRSITAAVGNAIASGQ